MLFEVSCQKDKLEKMGTPHHMLDKKKIFRAAKSSPGQIDQYAINSQ